MLLDVLLIFVGGGLLYFGADWLVGGASSLARAFGVSPLVVGLTVVSYGTSAPELVVSLLSALEGQSDVALGNVVGSNVANIGCVLGLTALIRPPMVDAGLFRREVPLLLVATLAVGPVLLNGRIDRYEGAVFFAGAIAFSLAAFRWSQTEPRPAPAGGTASADNPAHVSVESSPDPTLAVETAEAAAHKGRSVLFVVLGTLALVLGGKLFVDSAVSIAKLAGVSPRVIALTLVALGTSLPELVTSIVAAMRGESDLAVGNVVGSNLFNILLILGLTSTITPIEGSLRTVRLDLIVMTLMTMALAVSLRKARHISRMEGGFFALCYIGFTLAVSL